MRHDQLLKEWRARYGEIEPDTGDLNDLKTFLETGLSPYDERAPSEISRLGGGENRGVGSPDPPPSAKAIAIRPTPFVWRDPASLPVRQWLYGRHYIRKFVSATVASPGVGKSTLALAEDVVMATGRPLLGNRIDKPLRVWSWSGEDPIEEIERRVAAICLHYGITADEIGDRLFLDSGREQEIVVARAERSGFVIAAPIIAAVRQAILDHRIDVLRIDPFVSCHRVGENDNGAVDAVVKAWARIADETNCAVELVHHVRKTGGAEVTTEDARGASALLGAVRWARVLNVMTEDEATRAGVENRRLYFRVDNGKSNLAPPADASDWFRLVSVSLGNGAGGPDDQVGVATAWKWPNALDGLCVADLRKVQERIADGEWRASSQAAAWAGKAIADVLEIDLSDRATRERVKTMLKTWITNGALKIVKRLGSDRHEHEFIEVGEPAI